jgi:hypothetical protein
MIKTANILSVFVCTALVCTSLSARENVEERNSNSNTTSQGGRAANCAPGVRVTDLAFNNVRTVIETPGTMWQDRSRGVGAYYVPAPSNNEAGPSSIFAGALWMGGLDPAGNLKLAAVRFRQVGNDFWPGPLTTDGSATVDFATCAKYDQHYYISRRMVELHRLYFLRLYEDQINGTNTVTEEPFEDGYSIPEEILNWPAHGQTSLGQDFYLAPFAENLLGGGTEGLYEPELGDYPWYDLDRAEDDCKNRNRTSPIPLFGDDTLWWVFNDKGNIHTETQGLPIGMEIKAQAFAFQTQDEVNSMTFYNYTLINRGTQTLTNTFFGQWVDPDLGGADDDYIGCDVQRGLGYAYNGDNNDESQGAAIGYGFQPPAIGVDFFEGPYQDSDGIDNPGPNPDSAQTQISFNEAFAGNGIPYGGIGIGYGDNIVDNERFGMRRYMYFTNNAPTSQSDPQVAVHYYNYLRGIWRDGTELTHGGTGYAPSNPNGVVSQYAFPGDTDPVNWGTAGIDPGSTTWSEAGESNPAGDRRFVQSAGPFTLSPGDFNNITVGVVWARAATGGPFASVLAVRTADDKAQALFDNCFRILDGPDAPDIAVQELDKEIILYISNNLPISNNFHEQYTEFDPTIPPFTAVIDEDGQPTGETIANDQFYRFQGYQIYQVKDETVDVSDVTDPSLARLAFQVDVRDGITQLINYVLDPVMGLPVPNLRADGADEGIKHSFRVNRDLFATDDDRLINFKRYYYVAIAYGSNLYQDYDPNTLTGQQNQYLAGRKSPAGPIRIITAIPHIPAPETYGTVSTSSFGDGFEITRVEGSGNGRLDVELTAKSVSDIMDGSPWKADELTYQRGRGPVNIKVVDPLNVKEGKYRLRLFNDVIGQNPDGTPIYESSIDSAKWSLENMTTGEIINSSRTIEYAYEQIIPDFGISVEIEQYEYDFFGRPGETRAEFLSWSVNFSDPNRAWLFGIEDTDDFTLQNWIMSGRVNEDPEPEVYEGAPCYRILDGGNEIDPSFFNDLAHVTLDETFPIDGDKMYDNIFGGTIAPFRLVRPYNCGPSPLISNAKEGEGGNNARKSLLSDLQNIDIIYTPDRELWSRVPVLEMQSNPELAENGGLKLRPRVRASVDKFGNPTPDGVTTPSTNPNDPNYISATGMGWFPGYVINVGTGERLNMAFGEDSYLAADNGRDMIWNPSPRIFTQPLFSEVFGGQHYVYIFKNNRLNTENNSTMPGYDAGQYLMDNLSLPINLPGYRAFWKDCIYVQSPLTFGLLPLEDGLIPTETRLSIRVAKPYAKYATLEDLGVLDYSETGSVLNPLNPTLLSQSENDWYPMYEFSIDNTQSTVLNNIDAAKEALDLINIVPNPYYAYSEYETSRLDNRVKFTNLPPECTIKIFTVNGTLVRTFGKDNPLTFLDWDLKNEARIPVAGGVYIIHVSVPDVGERVLKWFAVMRPTDLNNF